MKVLQAKGAQTARPIGTRMMTPPGRNIIQRASVKDIKTSCQKTFKYSDRMDNPYVMIDTGGGWHLSFHPDGEGGDKYKEAVINAALEYSYNGGNVSDGQWVRDWMTEDLPFKMFHATSPAGNHFYFSETGETLGEKKGKGTGITEEERMHAWRLSGIVSHGRMHQQIRPTEPYNWAPKNSPLYRTSPPGLSGQVLTGIEKPRTNEPWPKAKLENGEMKFG